jgi:hypothetical protein
MESIQKILRQGVKRSLGMKKNWYRKGNKKMKSKFNSDLSETMDERAHRNTPISHPAGFKHENVSMEDKLYYPYFYMSL